MKVFCAGILVVALSGFLIAPGALAAGDDGSTEASASTESDSSASAQKMLLGDIEVALSHLASGGGLRNLSADQRRAVVEAVLDKLGYPPKQATEARATDNDDASSVQSPAKRILTLSDWCLYLRISRLDTETAKAVAKELRKDGRSSVRWTLLDLRRVAGDGGDGVAEMATAFESRKAPLVVLVGVGTRKGAKQLIEKLRSKRSVVTIGDPTQGTPYGTRELSLPSGIAVNVPDFSDASTSAAQRQLTPDITVSYRGRGLDPTVFKQDDKALRQDLLRDPPIRRAMDTLTAARAFAEPHF